MPRVLVAALLFGACGSMALGADQLPSLATPRQAHFAFVRDDDKVYVFGGQNLEAGDFLELYDPASGSTRLASPGRHYTGDSFALLLDGNRIFLCGKPCEVYLPDGNRWEEHQIPGYVAPMARLVDGTVLRAGGNYLVYFPTFLIDPKTFEAREAGRMLDGLHDHFLTTMAGGRAMAAGGTYWLGTLPAFSSQFVEIFDPAAGTWTWGAVMHSRKPYPQGLNLQDGRVLVADRLYANGDAEIYDPKIDKWVVVPGLRTPTDSALTLLPDGRVLISGGYQNFDGTGSVLQTTSIFDPTDMSTRPGMPMQIPRAKHVVVVLHDGTVLALGGVTTGGVATASVEVLTRITPTVVSSAVANGASFTPGASPGSIASIFGTNLTGLAPGTVKVADKLPLPIELNGVSVTANAISAPLLAIANTGGYDQINLQIPSELAGQTMVTIAVRNNGLIGYPIQVPLQAAQPGIFVADWKTGTGAILHSADFALVSAIRPAQRGEIVTIFATGLGPVTPAVATGQPASAAPLSVTSAPPAVTFGGVAATDILYSGLAPGFVGLYQVNVRVPSGTPSGNVDVVIQTVGQSSKPVKLAVQ